MAAFETLSEAASTITEIFRSNAYVADGSAAGADGDPLGCAYVTCVSGAAATFIAYDFNGGEICKRTLAAGLTDYLYASRGQPIHRLTATGAANAATVVSAGCVAPNIN